MVLNIKFNLSWISLLSLPKESHSLYGNNQLLPMIFALYQLQKDFGLKSARVGFVREMILHRNL